ncbi:flavin-dependent oxidoreductase [Actinomadura yumaensis]|uniref:Flavin-dependent oxidoreductase n=1 Tax=Actinomadura yumaensis TaxID=111807 RepID=A0ABW2CK05_9ACTN
MRVLIVGAGIGGLTAALSLHAAGVRAQVVDASALRPLGVGINLLPQATRELTELGLGADLAATGVETAEMVHFDRHGGRIWAEPRGRALGHAWPQYSIHRGELQSILLRAVRARLGDAAVRTGTACEDFTDRGTHVRAVLRDRASGAATAYEADALVGADGLHSRVRARLHPHEPPPLWNGIRMWRGVTEAEPFLTGRTLAVAGSNTAAKIVVYPVGGGLTNWVAEVRTPAADLRADWDRTGRLEDVLPHYADWTFPWLDVPALLSRTARILEYPMVDRDPLPFWTRHRVTLLGDAAHPMYPVGSNGGTQAVLDARALARELARSPDVPTALAAYDAARRDEANAIVLACRDMPADRILHTVAERAPNGFTAIEDVLTPEELDTITTAYRRTSSNTPDPAPRNSP